MKKPDYTKFPFRPFEELSSQEREEKFKQKNFLRFHGEHPEHITDKTIFFDIETSEEIMIEGFYTNSSIDERLKTLPFIKAVSVETISRDEWEKRIYK